VFWPLRELSMALLEVGRKEEKLAAGHRSRTDA
jgi:hypothetical protein